jgi:hypothetical protein
MFAIVSVEMAPAKTISVQLSAELVAADERDVGPVRSFEAAARVGIQYAWERASRTRRPDGATITISELTILAVDTTIMQVVYAAARATWEALGCEEAEFPISMAGRSFVIPA